MPIKSAGFVFILCYANDTCRFIDDAILNGGFGAAAKMWSPLVTVRREGWLATWRSLAPILGIGTGAVCTTRMVAGTGYPQLSAIRECSRIEVGPYFDSKKLPIVCDGGCYHPGDFAKAFAAGAQMVMAGSVFAGHAEGGIQPVDGMVEFRGNAALPEPAPDGQTYRSSEGRIVKIPFKGSVNATVEHILGGLRSASSYSNALSLPELSKNAKFIRVNNQLNTVIERYTI